MQQFLLMQKAATVIFIEGGPGAGKGTICQRIQSDFKLVHLSAGELLRAERKQPGSQYGEVIEKHLTEGKVVPSEVTVMLLQRAMGEAGFQGGRFLIDGFPRYIENLAAWEKLMSDKVEVPLFLHLVCSEEVMLQRVLKRGESSGRLDDNIDSIKKRLQTYR